jgi:hypothetical protein
MTANGEILYAAFMNLAARTLIVAAAILLFPAIAFACSCAPRMTVLEAYDASEVVVVARVLSVEKFGKEDAYLGGVRSTKLVIEKVYKGNLRAGDEIKLPQGGGADCIWMFSARDVGNSYLFYLNTIPRGSTQWIASTCSRSDYVNNTTEDLLYLDNLDKVRGKTRVSGRYSALNGTAGLDVANRKIRIVGEGKSVEVITDKNGVFEIYDLPSGNYRLEPETPKGWKLAVDWLDYSPSVIEKQSTETSVAFKLEPQKHASIDLRFMRLTDAR